MSEKQIDQMVVEHATALEKALEYLELARQYEKNGMTVCARIAREKAAALLE